ncbi:uncharacterized protein [Neodiprion pinetum]|uniref:uncharacterized protein n=1 Tax=Neodiprion pinetum TaxID=441929 RepID=UPI00371662FE
MSAKYFMAQESHMTYLSILHNEVDSGDISTCTIFDAEIKLEALEATWNKIVDAHDKLIGCKDIDASHAYFKEGRYTMALQRYTLIIYALKKRANELEPRLAPLSPHNVTMLDNAHHYRPQLPTIQPPRFNGELLEWQSFKNKFMSVVSKDGITEIDKMHYLLQSVHGTAYSLIANVDITATAFADAWQALTTRYENKRVLITAQLNKLFNIPKMASRSAQEVNTQINTTNEVLNSLKSLGSPVDQWDHLLVHYLTHKLDPQTREDWELTLGSAADYPTLERLKAFLIGRARALETLEDKPPAKQNPKSNSKANKKSPSGNKGTPGTKASTAHVHMVSASPQNTCSTPHTPTVQTPATQARPQSPCSCCGAPHFIVSCPSFHNLTPNERHQQALSKNLCLKCLGLHALENCRSKKRCRPCQAAHHSMLHDSQHLNTMRARADATALSQTSTTPQTSQTTSA